MSQRRREYSIFFLSEVHKLCGSFTTINHITENGFLPCIRSSMYHTNINKYSFPHGPTWVDSSHSPSRDTTPLSSNQGRKSPYRTGSTIVFRRSNNSEQGRRSCRGRCPGGGTPEGRTLLGRPLLSDRVEGDLQQSRHSINRGSRRSLYWASARKKGTVLRLTWEERCDSRR